MRLDVLDNGHPFSTKALFAVIRVMSGHRAPDVVKTLRYRPDFFGAPMGDRLPGSHARPVGVVDRRPRAHGGVRLEGQRLRVLNESPRRGRVEDSRR